MVDTAIIDKAQIDTFSFVFGNGESPAKAPKLSPLIDQLRQIDEQTAQQMLGNIGTHLWRLAQVADRLHPDFELFHQGALLAGNTNTSKLSQIMEAWQHAKQQKWDMLLPLYRKMARHGLSAAFTSIRAPQDNQRFVRLVADADRRTAIRASKQVRSIHLYPFYKKGEAAWHIQPPDFELFVPGSKNYEKQIAEAKKKAARFKTLGCESMNKAVMDALKTFLETFENLSYHGFYRITATNAAIILAKMHGYEIQSPVRNNDARMLRVPEQYGQFFKSKNGQPVEDDDERRLIEELEKMVAQVAARDQGKDKLQLPERKASTTLIYAPTIYPLPLFLKLVYGIDPGSKILPPLKSYQIPDSLEAYDVSRMIAHLEAYPMLNGRPMFDHFLVLVPSPQPFFWDAKAQGKIQPKDTKEAKKAPKVAKPKAPEKKEEKPAFTVSLGDKIEEFPDAMSAKIHLDTMLVRDQLVKPIVLGERDGQCFFLGFWN